MIRTRVGLAVAVALGVMGACKSSAPTAGDGAIATFSRITGELESSVAEPLDEVYAASQKAVKRLELEVLSDSKDALSARIETKGATGDKTSITLRREAERITKIEIVVGTLGDESKARTILDEIKREMR
jgi:ABC-type glycerol-3-phosphate transport system substrate-binding protein